MGSVGQGQALVAIGGPSGEGVAVYVALTLGVFVTVTGKGGGSLAAAAVWRGRNDTTTATTPIHNVKSMSLAKCFMVFLLSGEAFGSSECFAFEF